jgi:hypothetical protein
MFSFLQMGSQVGLGVLANAPSPPFHSLGRPPSYKVLLTCVVLFTLVAGIVLFLISLVLAVAGHLP